MGRSSTNLSSQVYDYRPGIIPECFDAGGGLTTFVAYDAFYKFNIVNGQLVHPESFFVTESAILLGHLGSGIITVDSKVLWSPGDCTSFVVDGASAPHLDHEHCGKILSIDPNSIGVYDIVIKGVRNPQQMRVFACKSAKFHKSPKVAGPSNQTRPRILGSLVNMWPLWILEVSLERKLMRFLSIPSAARICQTLDGMEYERWKSSRRCILR